MTASVRNVGLMTTSFGTAATLVPTMPTHQANDILICFVGSSANASVTPTHSITGWTLITSGVIASGVTRSRVSAYWIRATGSSETAPTVDLTPTGTTACHHFAGVISYQDCITSGTPYEGANNNGAAGAASIAVTRGATTTNRLSVIAAHHADNIGTTWSEDHADAYTARYSTDNATGIDGNTLVADTGPISDNDTITWTVASGGTGVGISGLAFALLPTAGASYTDTQTDTANASDSYAPAMARTLTQTETAVATDTHAAAMVLGLDQADTAVATDTYDSALVGAGTTHNLDQTDTAVATDTFQAYRGTQGTETDTAVATDSFQGYLTRQGVETETAVATDVVEGLLSWTATQTDTAAASDVYDFELLSAGVAEGVQVDTAAASDSYDFGLVIAASMVEAARATDTYNSAVPAAPSAHGPFYVWDGANWV